MSEEISSMIAFIIVLHTTMALYHHVHIGGVWVWVWVQPRSRREIFKGKSGNIQHGGNPPIFQLIS